MKLPGPLPQAFVFSFSKVCLILSGIVLLLSPSLLSAPGGFVLAYFIALAFALAALAWGSRKQRMVAAVFCWVSLALTVADVQDGFRFQKRIMEAPWRAKMLLLENEMGQLRRELEELRQERARK